MARTRQVSHTRSTFCISLQHLGCHHECKKSNVIWIKMRFQPFPIVNISSTLFVYCVLIDSEAITVFYTLLPICTMLPTCKKRWKCKVMRYTKDVYIINWRNLLPTAKNRAMFLMLKCVLIHDTRHCEFKWNIKSYVNQSKQKNVKLVQNMILKIVLSRKMIDGSRALQHINRQKIFFIVNDITQHAIFTLNAI